MFGGALGSICRAIVQRVVERHTPWPGWTAICIVNVIGSFIIGLTVSYISTDLKEISLLNISPSEAAWKSFELNELRIFLAVGFCGAFTTFSTFALDTVILLHTSRTQACINVVGSTLMAFGAAYFGWYLGGGICL